MTEGAESDFAGFVGDTLPYPASAAVFPLTSEWEGLPAVLIEALFCGCPVVSTDCPTGPHEILDGYIEALFPEESR